MQYIEKVILPADNSIERTITPGKGNNLQKRIIPKLEALLFVLQEVFNLDIESDEAVGIWQGAISPGMMRQTSYNIVEIPQLERLVLSCDEQGNATFILDLARCQELGIDAEGIADHSKDELKELIEKNEYLGAIINYSNTYPGRLVKTLSDRLDDSGLKSKHERLTPLKPRLEKAPEGYLSANGISKVCRSSDSLVAKAISAVQDQLGEVGSYMFAFKPALGYSPEQQQIILDYLNLADHAPEGYLSIWGMWEQCGVDRRVIARAIDTLSDQLGEVKKYRFYAKTVPGYSPEQQRIIFEYIDSVQSPPEGYLSVKGIIEKYHGTLRLISRAIEELGGELGEVKKYRLSSNHINYAYSPEQQRVILQYIYTRNKRVRFGQEVIAFINGTTISRAEVLLVNGGDGE